MSVQTPTNRLADSASPYLLQHAHNPVDWYPWGEEALERARREDRPILLSIGYSACHWCHVMERESFEDPAIARLMNEHFVCIKVDREERPDLDEVYMAAVQLLTGSGGWPLNVFLTPDLKPFHGGTYYPPEDRWGRPGFARVLRVVAEAYREKRAHLEDAAEELRQAVAGLTQTSTSAAPLGEETLRRAAAELRADFDAEWGGFGGAPKFPPTSALSLLLRVHARTGDEQALRMVTVTLDRMAQGGLRDQLGGGSHRYSVDREWLVPHFEKTLYDNALLAVAYLEGAQVTGRALYREVARETLQYLLREMRDAGGAFHATQDADSEGEEGRYYLWGADDIARVLGPQDGALFSRCYGVTLEGNLEGRNVLSVSGAWEEVAGEHGMAPAELEQRLTGLRGRLLAERATRVAPGKDDKVLADWNGLALSAFAKGYRVLGEPAFLQAAERAADFVLEVLRPEGRLRHAYRGGRSYLDAYLDDYAFLAQGLVDLSEAALDVRRLDAARSLAEEMIALLWHEDEGGFYLSVPDPRGALVRTRRAQDGATPAGNAVAALTLLRLAALTGCDDYRERAERVLALFSRAAGRAPRAFAGLLAALDFSLGPTREIVLCGARGAPDTRALAEALGVWYLPNAVVAGIDPSASEAAAARRAVPAVAAKEMVGGRATVYVCDPRGCRPPVTSPEALRRLLSDE